MFASLALISASLAPNRLDDSTKLLEAMTTVMTGSTSAIKDTTLGYRDGISILGAYLDAGKSIAFSTSFEAGAKYVLVAGGDNNADDIDVAITADGRTLAKDDSASATAVAGYQCTEDQDVRYVVTNSSRRRAMVCLTVLTDKGGWGLDESLQDKFLINCKAVTQALQSYHLGWAERRNSWCLYGGVVRPGAELSMYSVPIPTGGFAAVAFHDTKCNKTKLAFAAEDGSETASTTGDEFVTVLPIPTSYHGKTGFTVTNMEGDPSLMAVAIGG